MDAVVQRADGLRGTVTVPGDKSIAHRALIFGAMARGEQRIIGLPDSEDVASTAACLRTLGCSVSRSPDGSVRVRAGEWQTGREIFAGNSGTTARLLSGLIAGKGLDCTIDGDASLRSRPMARIADPLTQMGARIETSAGGCLPMCIRSDELRGITYRPAVASAQVKSAILIAGLFADGITTVIEKAPTRDHTETMLRAMGVSIERRDLAVSVKGGGQLEAVEVQVPGDISSAAFFLVAASLVPRSEVVLRGTGVNPTRAGALNVLKEMGADITHENAVSLAGEPIADLLVRSSRLRAVDIGGAVIPTLIDELPILAVAATQADGVTIVSGAEELRHKESDRISATVGNLRHLGADIEERPDGFVVRGPCRLKGNRVDSAGDHRIAMAMAVAALVAEGETEIASSEAVAISYPGFFEELRALCG